MGHLPVVRTNYQHAHNCTTTGLNIAGQTVRKLKGLIYPINVARNVARNFATTTRVLVSDIELLPSEKLASSFITMLHGRQPRLGLIFVVPVFEIKENQQTPKNKCELITAIKNGQAVYFHKYVCIHCQRFPGITRWLLRPDPGQVKPLIITRREYPHHRWEPLYIGTQQDPFYNEDMSWEGQQDKMVQVWPILYSHQVRFIIFIIFYCFVADVRNVPDELSFDNT